MKCTVLCLQTPWRCDGRVQLCKFVRYREKIWHANCTGTRIGLFAKSVFIERFQDA
jgi:hypothetical protein